MNINLIRNKLENLRKIIDGNVCLLYVAETKTGSSFPISQFPLKGYHSPYRLDVSNRRDGLFVYANASILTRQLKHEIKYKDIQIISS